MTTTVTHLTSRSRHLAAVGGRHPLAAFLCRLDGLRPGATRRLAADALQVAMTTDAYARAAVFAMTAAAEANARRGTTYGDPVAVRVQARKRRIEKSGLRLVQGGGL